jgi:uncharacterized protein (TIGR00297 family)
MTTLHWGLFSLALSCALAYRGLKRGSLSPSGASAAVLVGAICLSSGKLPGLLLLLFYFAGTAATRHGAAAKAAIDGDLHKSARSAAQVLCTSGVGVALLAWRRLLPAACELHDPLFLGYIGSLACVLGDTLASELGVLSRAPPRLITSCARVPRGTNGGCSPEGLLYSAAGGALLGGSAAAYLAVLGGSEACLGAAGAGAAAPWPLLRLAACASAVGLAGSLVDSLLGATLQASYYRGGKALLEVPLGEVAVPPPEGAAFEDWPRVHPVGGGRSPPVYWVSGLALCSNEVVNLVSSAASAALMAWLMGAGGEGLSQ